MANATVAAQGIGITNVWPNQVAPATVLQPGSSAQITNPTDISVGPGGVAAVTTSDGSTVAVDPNAAFSFYTPGTLPALNPWDLAIIDTASGWAFRLSNLNVPAAFEAVVGAPNATDGLTITAPDNTSVVINVTNFQNVSISSTWTSTGSGEAVQISSITVTIQDQTQYVWTQGVGWSGSQNSPL